MKRHGQHQLPILAMVLGALAALVCRRRRHELARRSSTLYKLKDVAGY